MGEPPDLDHMRHFQKFHKPSGGWGPRFHQSGACWWLAESKGRPSRLGRGKSQRDEHRVIHGVLSGQAQPFKNKYNLRKKNCFHLVDSTGIWPNPGFYSSLRTNFNSPGRSLTKRSVKRAEYRSSLRQTSQMPK